MAGPADIDAYLAELSDADRAVLVALRAGLNALLPGADEVISYNLPGLRYEGRMVAGFGASRNFCSLYPHSGGVLPDLQDEIRAAGLTCTKSALHFTEDRPLPDALLKAVLRARLREAGIALPATLT